MQEACKMFRDVARQAQAAVLCLAGSGKASQAYQGELRSQLPASSGRLTSMGEEKKKMHHSKSQALHHLRTLQRLANRYETERMAHRYERHPSLMESWVQIFDSSLLQQAWGPGIQAMASSLCRMPCGKAHFLYYPDCDVPALLSAAFGDESYL